MGGPRNYHTKGRKSETARLREKKRLIPESTKRMDLEIIILSEVNQKEKGKYYMISLISRI